jgi:hypothetical protein
MFVKRDSYDHHVSFDLQHRVEKELSLKQGARINIPKSP